MNSIRTRRRWQFSLQAIFVATVVALCAIWIGISISRILTPRPDWVYNQQLHQEIATANRIDVRYGHEQEVANTSTTRLLFSIDTNDEVADVRRQLRFERRQSFGGCSCDGLLHIQWYRDNHLVADTSLIHGQSIRWNAVPGDMSLTDRSAKRIQQWLTRHGLSPTFVTDPPWPN